VLHTSVTTNPLSVIHVCQLQTCNYGVRLIFKQADWGKLQMLCEEQFKDLSVKASVDYRFNKVVNGIYLAASQSIPLSSGIKNKREYAMECQRKQ